MGVCFGSTKDSTTKDIEKALDKDAKANRQIKKLLLLGAGGSGKSTLFKQLKSIHGSGITEKEKLSYKDIVYNNIIDGMKTLIEKNRELIEQFPEEYGELRMQSQTEESAEFIEYLRNDVDVNIEIAKHIQQLWTDPGIAGTFDNRAKFQIQDSAAYFFDNVERIAQDDYVPSEEDVLRARVRTTGIVEQEFEIKGNIFRIFDVGGQRNERKKWIHCFDSVTAVIFVTALSAYDQTLFEDETTNRMHESLTLFEEICNSRWFTDTAMILFMNKSDLFREKIAKVPLTKAFKDYQGAQTYDDCVAYLKYLFSSKNYHPQKKHVYCHVTCAMDRGQIESVFQDVQHIVIQQSIKLAGLQ